MMAISDWTAAGGGVLLVGLGWSWPNAFADYPMVRLAEPSLRELRGARKLSR